MEASGTFWVRMTEARILVMVMNRWKWECPMRHGSEELGFTSEKDIPHKKKLRLS